MSQYKRKSWRAEEILQGILERCDPRGEHAKDVAAIRQSLTDNGTISNTGGAQRTLGLSVGGTMRFAGSIPEELWYADQMLHPYLNVKERCRKLLKEFPQFRTGNI